MTRTGDTCQCSTAERKHKMHRLNKRNKFKRYRHQCGLGDREQCARLLGVSLRTLRRYDNQKAPKWAFLLCGQFDRHELGKLADEWKGWKISRGKLTKGKTQLRPENVEHWQEWNEKLTKLESNAGKCPHPCLIKRLWER